MRSWAFKRIPLERHWSLDAFAFLAEPLFSRKMIARISIQGFSRHLKIILLGNQPAAARSSQSISKMQGKWKRETSFEPMTWRTLTKCWRCLLSYVSENASQWISKHKCSLQSAKPENVRAEAGSCAATLDLQTGNLRYLFNLCEYATCLR